MVRSDRDRVLSVLRSELDISDETVARLEIYEALLLKWQTVQNLVSRETVQTLWTRHICDSARLWNLVRKPASWLDIGSGAGFPGLITAILQKQFSEDHSCAMVDLVESNSRKVAFLRAVIRETGISAVVHDMRIDAFFSQKDITPDYISARALASLDELLAMVEVPVQRGSRCFFHKGRDITAEISVAADRWDFDLIQHQSCLLSDMMLDGVIVEVSNIRRKIGNS